MKRTHLYNAHLKLGASIVEFGGWDMPVYYTTVIDEHMTTRTKAAIFDICHMGEIDIKGKDSLKLIQKLITGDASKLVNGKAMYSVMCYESGMTIDDLFVYKFNDTHYMLVVNAANIEKDFSWIKKHTAGMNAEVRNLSDKIGKIDLQGPESENVLQKMTEADLKSLKRFFFVEDKVSGIKAIISRTGYTGEDGFEIYFGAKHAEKMWNALLDAGKEFGLKPAGLGARDTLRLESCYSLYGDELDETISPVEASIEWVVKPAKGEFIGKKALEKQLKEGVKRKLVAIEMIDKGIPRHGYKIFKDDEEIGAITSGTFSPTFKKSIALGFVKTGHSSTGTGIYIDIRGKKYKARVSDKPFYSFHGKK